MTEAKFSELIAQGRCPAEYAREQGHNVPADCEYSGSDCRKCLEGVLVEA